MWFDSLAVQFKPWRIPNPFMLGRMYPRVWICFYLLHFLQRTRIIGKFLLFLALIQQLLLNKKFTNLRVFPFLQNSHLKVLKYSLHYIVFFLPHSKKEINLVVVELGGDNLLSFVSCEYHVFHVYK